LITTHGGISNPQALGKAEDHGFFDYAYHYAFEYAEHHRSKIQNYVALYGFLRTMALVFAIAVWIALWHSWINPAPVAIATAAIVGLATTSYLLYAAFLKFYFRYAQEVLMAFAAVYADPPEHR
jgi:hypothetical protein